MSGRGRGRKPAAAKLQATAVADGGEVVAVPPAEAEKGKRGARKKQFPVVAVVTPDGIQGNLQMESRRPLIVHLPIQSKDVAFNDMPLTYDPMPPGVPEPYDNLLMNPFSDMSEQLSSDNNVANTSMDTPIISSVTNNTQSNQSLQNTNTQVTATTAPIDFYSFKGTLLVQYSNSSEIKKIPESSDAACFWCCHTFEGRPVVLPLRDQGEYLQVFGNFCCPECASAYLFDMRQDSHTRWEQLALLYRVYGDVCGGKIHPAPSKNILKHFGGLASIEDYRAMIRSYKVRVDVHMPPMVSLLSTMDTKPIDFYDTNTNSNLTETVKERLQKAEEVLRLKRTKPLKAWESTLDACINLKIRQEE
jgi:hypothetical protein